VLGWGAAKFSSAFLLERVADFLALFADSAGSEADKLNDCARFRRLNERVSWSWLFLACRTR